MEVLTNEEIVELIQGGDEAKKKEYIEQLWEQCYKFIHYQAYKRLHGRSDQFEKIDDLCQVGYFAMMDAAKSFSPEGGRTFISWLAFHLKNHFNEELNWRTVAQKKAPDRYAISLDSPLRVSEDGMLTVADIVPDPAAEEDYEAVLEAARVEDIKKYVHDSINQLPGKYKEFFEIMLKCDLSVTVAAKVKGCSRQFANDQYAKGKRFFRHYSIRNMKLLEELDIWTARAFSGCGVMAFKQSGYSSTESAAIKKIEFDQKQINRDKKWNDLEKRVKDSKLGCEMFYKELKEKYAN